MSEVNELRVEECKKEYCFLAGVFGRNKIAGKHKERLVRYSTGTRNTNFCITCDEELKELLKMSDNDFNEFMTNVVEK